MVNNGRAGYRRVNTGIEDFSRIEIVNGVQAGEKVILPQGQFIADGAQVNIIEEL